MPPTVIETAEIPTLHSKAIHATDPPAVPPRKSRIESITTVSGWLRYGRQLARLIDQASFPAVHAAVVSVALEDEDPTDPGMDAEFEFGVERILDGIAVLIDTQRLPK